MQVTRFTGLSNPAINYQRKARERITVLRDEPDTFRLECRKTDTGVAAAPTNKGCRCELALPPSVTGLTPRLYDAVNPVLFYFELGGELPTSRANWSARAQLHGPNQTGQASGFVCTPDGKWHVRLWDAGTQRQLGMFPVIDAAGRTRSFDPDERLGFALEVVPSTDPKVGRVRLLVDGVEVVDRRLQTLHARRLDGSVIAPADQGIALKAGLYLQASEAPPKTIATVGKITRVSGEGADFDSLLEAVGGGIVVGPPPSLPPTDPCDPIRAELLAARSERDSMALALEARAAEVADLRHRMASARGALEDPPTPEGAI